MTVHTFRRRIFAALGIPLGGLAWSACQPPSPEAPDGPEPTTGGTAGTTATEATTSTSAGTPSGDGAPRACGEDAIPERLCGTVAEPGQPATCGPTAQSLIGYTYGSSALFVSGPSRANDPMLSDWAYSEPATDRFRGTMGGAPPDMKQAYCCYEHCTKLHVSKAFEQQAKPGSMPVETCIPKPDSTRVPALGAPECPAAVEISKTMLLFSHTKGAESCCYMRMVQMPDEPRPHRGRPLRIEGEARAAAHREGVDWARRPTPTVAGISAEDRARLADAWRGEALLEHASIAAFSKLALWLMALGAGPDLLRETHAAALDEVSHAEIAFSFASAYGGALLAPAPFPDAAMPLGGAASMRDLVVETIADGCAGEAVAAIEAVEAAEQAEDPVIREALSRIAEEEARHAELAFRILTWAVEHAPQETFAQVRRARDNLVAELRDSAQPPTTKGPLTRFGLLGAAARRDIRRRVLGDVTIPALTALLARGAGA